MVQWRCRNTIDMALDTVLHRWRLSFVAILGLLGVLGIVSTRTCAACMLQSPGPRCSATLSRLTLHAQDEPDAWWRQLLPHAAHTLSVYLSLDYLGAAPADVIYRVDVEQTTAGSRRSVTSKRITVRLDPASRGGRHSSYRIDIPYQDAPVGDLELTATRIAGGGSCDFPVSLTTTLPIVSAGPTVWPVTPRVCARAGEQPEIIFGVHNPGPGAATLSLVARASDPFGSQTFALEGQDDEVNLPPIRLGPDQARRVEVDCATFGYCLAGAQNNVELEVRSAEDNGLFLSPAVASANVVIRAPGESCASPRDWWFLLPSGVGSWIGGLTVLVAGLLWLRTTHRARRRDGTVDW